MSRRITLPGADELFRVTGGTGPDSGAAELMAPRPLSVAPDPAPEHVPSVPAAAATTGSQRSRNGVRQTARPRTRQGQDRLPSGRERHDEKITVYVSQDELVALEQARLVLRAEHGIAIDRGRLVREAVAEMLLDLETAGEDSVVVSRLRPAP